MLQFYVRWVIEWVVGEVRNLYLKGNSQDEEGFWRRHMFKAIIKEV